MVRDGMIWIGNNEYGEPLSLLPKMANRHGLVAGATGTGKTYLSAFDVRAFRPRRMLFLVNWQKQYFWMFLVN